MRSHDRLSMRDDSVVHQEETNLSKYFNLPNPGLRAYLMHTVAGNPEDYRPPFWQKAPRASVVKKWEKVVSTLPEWESLEGLRNYELECKAKVGPMSIQAPLDQRLNSIKDYYICVETAGIPIDANAVKAAGDYFSRAGGIRLRSQAATVEKMRLSTNSGSPYFTKRRNVVSKTVPVTVHGDEYRLANNQTYGLAAVLGWRGQENGPSPKDVKQRVVWMMPFALNVKELQLYQPAIEAIQKHGLLPAYVSMDAVDDRITSLFKWKDTDDQVICTDFTKFDQHFNSHLQNAAETVIRRLVAPSAEVEDWFKTVFPIKYTIPLVCSDDITFTGPHGMGSGSGGTNFDECMAHKALQFEAAQSIGSELNPYSDVLGDDGLLQAHGLTADLVKQSYSRHGLEMNADKQYSSSHDCVYLRRWHGVDYTHAGRMVGCYSTFRALGRLLAQERYYDPAVWGPEMVTLRAWSIIENCNHSPFFEEFVDFVLKGDKYRLGLSIPGFLDNVGALVKESTDLVPDFLGYTKSLQEPASDGVTNWRIYKYLKSKA